MKSVLLLSFLFKVADAVIRITSKELFDGMESGRWDVVVDVRRQDEWDAGHIENATFLINLSLYSGQQESTPLQSTPMDLVGCEQCTIAVYCRSGARAQRAAEILEANGFASPIYNGLGVSQWTTAGFPLVPKRVLSRVPPCLGNSTVCAAPPPPPPPAVTIGGISCFSGENQVLHETKGHIAMRDVRVGDSLLIGNKFEPVLGFLHYNPNAPINNKDFIIVETSTGKNLQVSSNHLIFTAQRGAIPASKLVVGDDLLSMNGATVTSIRASGGGRGMYAPYTPSGKLVVSDIVVSNYVALEGLLEDSSLVSSILLKAVSVHTLSHLWMAPRRYFPLAMNDNLDEQTTNEKNGIPVWAMQSMEWVQWLTQNNWTSIILVFILSACFVLESFMSVNGSIVALFAAVVGTMVLIRRRRGQINK